MPVLHTYTDPVGLKTKAVLSPNLSTPSPVGLARQSAAGVTLRLRKLTATNKIPPIPNSTGTLVVPPLKNKGSVYLSTFPPVYKTALGAEAGKVKTPRSHPPIYVNITR